MNGHTRRKKKKQDGIHDLEKGVNCKPDAWFKIFEKARAPRNFLLGLKGYPMRKL